MSLPLWEGRCLTWVGATEQTQTGFSQGPNPSSCFLSFSPSLTLLSPHSPPPLSLMLPLKCWVTSANFSGVQFTLDSLPYCNTILLIKICPCIFVYPWHCPRPQSPDLHPQMLHSWGLSTEVQGECVRALTHTLLPAPAGGYDGDRYTEQPSLASIIKPSGYLQGQISTMTL